MGNALKFFLAYLALVCSSAVSVAKPNSGLHLLWQTYRHSAYRDGGSVHVGLQNLSAKSVVVDSVHVERKQIQLVIESDLKKKKQIWWNAHRDQFIPMNVEPGDVMWHWLTRKEIPVGGMTELIIKFYRPPTQPVPIRISTNAGELNLTIEPKIAKAGISSVSFSKDRRKVFTYVENRSHEAIELKNVWLDGVEKTRKAKFVGRNITPGSRGCIVLGLAKPIPKGKRVYLTVGTRSGVKIGCSIRAFSYFPITETWRGLIRSSAKFDWDGLNSSKQYTKDPYYKLDVVGYEIIANRNNLDYLKPDQLMYYWSNQGFIKTGAWAFGELVDGARLHLQPLGAEYLGAYHPEDNHYVQGKMRFIRRALAPNPVFPQTEVGHAMMSDHYQSLLTPEEMRLRVYYMMSRGGKGILYRCGGGKLAEKSTPQERKALEDEIATLSEELFTLRPYLRIAEFVDGMAKTSEPLVEAASLMCGDKGLVILLLNHDRQQSWPKNEMHLGKSFWIESKPDPITITVNIPEPIKPKQVLEISGKEAFTVPFKFQDGKLVFTVNGIKTTRQYVVIPQSETIPEDWFFALPAENPRKVPGADVQFEEKQYFWGTVPPGEKVNHDFIVKNVGTEPLKLTIEKCPSGINANLPNKAIAPGESGTVSISCRPNPKELKGHTVVWLRTNDPNEPKVRLELGGYIKSPFIVSPDKIMLKHRLSGKDVSTARILVIDEKGGGLELTDPVLSSPDLKVSHKYKDHLVTKSHAEVYRGQYTKRIHTYDLSADLTGRKKSGEEWLTIKTNSDWKPEIKIPIVIEVEPAIVATPNRVFFGVVSKPATKSIKLHSPLGAVTVEESSVEEALMKLRVEKDGDDRLLKISLSIGDKQKTLRGEILLKCKVGDQIEELKIPYFAIVKPAP